MAHIPENILAASPLLPGLTLWHRGKVRDSYRLPVSRDLMLPVVSGRISIFDFVLNALIPEKGYVLNALNHFMRTKVLGDIVEHDLVACGAAIDAYLPESLRGNADLQKSATVVRICPGPEYEDVVRFILTGSGFKAYTKEGIVCGHRLPKGLTNGDALPTPLYTPTTKAQTGHDEAVTADSVALRFGFERERAALMVSGVGHSYLDSRGIFLGDTKSEFSLLPDGRLVLVDEILTPDSSRFYDRQQWEQKPSGALPPSLDKEPVRDYGRTVGITPALDPENPEDIAFVHSKAIPEDVIHATRQRYRYIFWRITGMLLETYQREVLGIDVVDPPRKIAVLFGSDSDVQKVLTPLWGLGAKIGNRLDVRVNSCHRDPDGLDAYVKDVLVNMDTVIVAAGMAAALPGATKAKLCAEGRADIPVIGVAMEGASWEQTLAARLSIEQLPEHPVELDQAGKAYMGLEGFIAACEAALTHEFLPRAYTYRPGKRLNVL